MIKIIIGIILIILYEIMELFKRGILNHPIALGILKIIFLNTILLVLLKKNYLVIKLKEVLPPILETATKMLCTPLKSKKRLV